MSAGEEARLDRVVALRRKVLGEAYVSAAMGSTDERKRDFQQFVTEFAWSTWDDEALSLREHSLVVVAMAAALGRTPELTLHLRGARNLGIDEAALAALVRKVVAYCGAPAGMAAWRAFEETGGTR